jgi:hypothetical protein
MALDIDLASVPSDPKAALGYAELHALWKTGQQAFDQGRQLSDAAYLIWMMQVRMHLTQEELAVFDQSPKDNSIDEFRDEKSAALHSTESTRFERRIEVRILKPKRRPEGQRCWTPAAGNTPCRAV